MFIIFLLPFDLNFIRFPALFEPDTGYKEFRRNEENLSKSDEEEEEGEGEKGEVPRSKQTVFSF